MNGNKNRLSVLHLLLAGTTIYLLAGAVGAQAPPAGTKPSGPSDYARRVVAYINETEPVSRQQLGEYLLARKGMDKLDLLINRKIIDMACRQAGVEVNAGEVEAALAEDLKGLNVDRARFIQDLLKLYGKNLYEWKEDIIRPKLLLGKLCRQSIQVTEDDINTLFDATYGEKIECRIILWPKAEEENAKSEYSALRDSEDAFAVKAKNQWRSSLAAAGGKIKPIARGTLGMPEVEREAFTLKPGEVSRLLPSPDGIVILKCDRRIPADQTVNRERVREEMEKQLRERKTLEEIPKLFDNLRKAANFTKNLPVPGSKEDTPESREPGFVVATIHDDIKITREDLGEFLITRYGEEKVELFVNAIILEKACAAKGVTCTAKELEQGMAKDLRQLNVDRNIFEKEFLKKERINLVEYMEDILKPKILLAKLTRQQVTVSEDDLKKAYEAYHGEKVECRLILWPRGEERHALMEYAKLRDDEKAFAQKAKSQASPSLAAKGGKIPPIGRYTTGNEELEKEAFNLQPGEVSRLIGTPEGTAILKCDARQAADSSVVLASVRGSLLEDTMERKVQSEMRRVFGGLREAAKPRFLLKDPNRPEDLAGDVKEEIDQIDARNIPQGRTKKKGEK